MKLYLLQMSETIHVTPEPHDSLNRKWKMTTATDALVLEGESSWASIYTLSYTQLKNAGSRRKPSPRIGMTIDYLILKSQPENMYTQIMLCRMNHFAYVFICSMYNIYVWIYVYICDIN